MAHILIVDDDPSLREVIGEAIKNLGHSFDEAEDGLDGLYKFKNNQYDVVLTDLKMPKMDGLQLLNEIKKIKYDAIILMITAYPTIDSAVQAIKLGAYDYITKPFKFEMLEVIINRALEKRKLLGQLGLFRGMFWVALFSIPFWIILGIIWVLLFKS